MARDESGALTLEHQKSNFGPLREPLALEWPADGLPCVIEPLSPVVQGISDKNDTRALLRLIHEFSARGEPVSTSENSPANAAKLLQGEPTYPRRKRPEVFHLLRNAERAGYIVRSDVRTKYRNSKECWQLTPEGAGFAEVRAAETAETAVTVQPSALTTRSAPSAASVCGGYGGHAARSADTAPLSGASA